MNTVDRTKAILSVKGTELTYIQKNLNTYLGHRYTINCFDSSTNAWQNMHRALKDTLNNPNSNIKEIMEKNLYLLFEKYPSLNRTIEAYVTRVVAEFNYGPNVDMELYRETRKMILAYIRRFHLTYFVRIPYIGHLWSFLMHSFNKKEMYRINQNLMKLFSSAKQTNLLLPIVEFRNRIENHFNPMIWDRIVLENSFLLMLENDFIYTVMMDQLVQPLNTTLEQSIYNGFLYPVRYRYISEKVDDMAANSFILFHLLNSKLYFSWGPRSCVGQTMVRQQIMPVIEKIKPWIIIDRNTNWYQTTRLDNLPEFKEIEEYSIKLSEDYIQNTIAGYQNSTTKIYDLITIYTNPYIMSYVKQKLVNELIPLNVDGIVAPEARALPLAGILSDIIKLPLYVIRKKGKIPGPVFQIEFNKGYTDQKDVLEIQKIDLQNKKLILIDDGIASGGSAKACIDLIKMCNGTIQEILVIIKHTYCACIDFGVPVKHIFTITKY